MNTPHEPQNPDLRYAEYVLGVLEDGTRAEVEQEIERDSEAAEQVRWWQQQLMPLVEELASVAPPDYVWARVQDALGHSQTVPGGTAAPLATEPGGVWNNLRFWHWFGLAAGAVAAACLVLLFTLPRLAPVPPAPPPKVVRVEVPKPSTLMISRIMLDNGVAGWTATMDATQGRMILTPAAPKAIAADKSTELWLIPPGQKPISLGTFPDQTTSSIKLPPAIVAKLGSKALLAVSVEPQGGSPTGQPTGPVIGKGNIEAAPSA